jgi:hypothetical protein
VDGWMFSGAGKHENAVACCILLIQRRTGRGCDVKGRTHGSAANQSSRCHRGAFLLPPRTCWTGLEFATPAIGPVPAPSAPSSRPVGSAPPLLRGPTSTLSSLTSVDLPEHGEGPGHVPSLRPRGTYRRKWLGIHIRGGVGARVTANSAMRHSGLHGGGGTLHYRGGGGALTARSGCRLHRGAGGRGGRSEWEASSGEESGEEPGAGAGAGRCRGLSTTHHPLVHLHRLGSRLPCPHRAHDTRPTTRAVRLAAVRIAWWRGCGQRRLVPPHWYTFGLCRLEKGSGSEGMHSVIVHSPPRALLASSMRAQHSGGSFVLCLQPPSLQIHNTPLDILQHLPLLVVQLLGSDCAATGDRPNWILPSSTGV